MRKDKPEFILLNGTIAPWQDAHVHITSEIALRGMNVFDGLRAYWDSSSQSHYIVEPYHHLERLKRGCEVLRFPFPTTIDEMLSGMKSLIARLSLSEDIYLRATVYLETGGYSAKPTEMSGGWFIVAYPVPSNLGALNPAHALISKWHKYSDSFFPTQVKAGGVYLLGRLARIEAQGAGYTETLLTNIAGRICETPGANIIIVKNGELLSPGIEEGALDGITLMCINRLLTRYLSKQINRVNIEVNDLLNADEAFACGTLDEIRPITRVNNSEIGSGHIGDTTLDLARFYHSHVRGEAKSSEPLIDLVEVSR